MQTDRLGGRMLWQSVVILVISLAVGLSFNSVRPDGLSLSARWSPLSRPEASGHHEDLSISFDEARDLFLTQEALFIDARDEIAYADGHIEGALNLPWHDFEARFPDIMPQLSPSRPIIAYCDGESCGLSKEVAVALLARGFDDVRVLVDGWSQWQWAGLPIAR